MKSNNQNRINQENLAELAAQSVDRAIDARKAAGIDLTVDEMALVSGGVLAIARQRNAKVGKPPITYPWGATISHFPLGDTNPF